MKIQQSFSLKNLNSFNVDCQSNYYVRINSVEDLKELIQTEIFRNNEYFVLGGGSNVLFAKDFDGLIIHPQFKGIKIDAKEDGSTGLEIGAAEVWEDLVAFTVNKGWWGIENLAAIPGNVGAAPVQNIGAYGVELKDVFVSLTAVDLTVGTERVFFKKDCDFSYRNSIFKSTFKNRYLITHVNLRLSKSPKPNTTYEALNAYLQQKKLKPGLKNIYGAVVAIRASKLPDPNEFGNAGSFFKNPVISYQEYEKLLAYFPGLKAYPQADGSVKLAAGWLIEACGLKGHRAENVGVYEKQALVLVNYGGAEGKAVLDLVQKVIKSVQDKFGITLTPEVNIL